MIEKVTNSGSLYRISKNGNPERAVKAVSESCHKLPDLRELLSSGEWHYGDIAYCALCERAWIVTSKSQYANSMYLREIRWYNYGLRARLSVELGTLVKPVQGDSE